MRYLNLGVVPYQESQAVYHALAELLTLDGPMTLVTVSPDRPYVCVGYHQVASREIERAYCTDHGIPVGRRMVGGGAVYLDGNQVFWHLIMPRRNRSVEELYRRFLAAPIAAYRRMGIAAEHRPINDIIVGNKKIGGTGASTMGQAEILVGSLMMDFDSQEMARVLNVPSEKFRDKMVSSLNEYMTTVTKLLGDRAPSRDEATRFLVEAFEDVIGEPIVRDTLTEREQRRLEYYAEYLFRDEFVYRHEGYFQPGVKIRDGVRLYEGLYKAPGGLIRLIWRERDDVLDEVLIGGDFFVDPPDALAALESELVGTPATPEAITAVLERHWSHLDIPGIVVPDILCAMSQGKALVTTHPA